LAERSAEDIAAALARLYRARLPSPEDIIDPGERAGRPRDDRGRDNVRAPGGDDRPERRPKSGKSSSKHGMAEGSVWFRANIGRRKNAEARWLLPMICRRGGIDKQDIGAIRIMDTTTEFEISKAVAETFAAKIKRPDKEDNIRIEALDKAPSAPAESRARPPRREGEAADHDATRRDKYRDGADRKPHGKPRGERGAPFDRGAGYEKKARRPHAADAARPHRSTAPPAKAPFAKKPKKKKRRD
jgi:ATP-dependent RNA helicase DeaD